MVWFLGTITRYSQVRSRCMFLTFIASFHAVLQGRKLFEKNLEDDGHGREEERRSQRELEFSRRERHVLQVELMMKQWIAGQDVGLLSVCLEVFTESSNLSNTAVSRFL